MSSQSLTLVSHHLRTASSRDPPIAIPTSHPLFQSSASSSSSSSIQPPAHATASLRTSEENDEDSYMLVARVLDDGQSLELSVLSVTPQGASLDFPQSSGAAPKLFTFPAPILSDLSIVSDQDSHTVYVVAVTVTGWLYRLRFPLPGGFYASTLPHNWAVEYRITSICGHTDQEAQNLGPKTPTLVHVVQPGVVLVACRDGSMVKLEQQRTDHQYEGAFLGSPVSVHIRRPPLTDCSYYTGPWQETSLRSTSFFSRFFSRSANNAVSEEATSTSPGHVVAVSSHLAGDSAALAFCICRDRRMRVWDLVTDSCLRTIDLPTATAEDLSPPQFAVTGLNRPLIHSCGIDSSTGLLHLLLFVPAPLPLGSRFAMYSAQVSRDHSNSPLGQVNLLWEKPCDSQTDGLRAELRDATFLQSGSHSALWSLWDQGGRTLLQHTTADLDDHDQDDEEPVWHTITSDRTVFSPLHGPELEDLLSEDDVNPADVLFPRIFESGRFAPGVVKEALYAYQDGLISTLANARLALPPVLSSSPASFSSTAQQLAETVGCAVRLETDPATGAMLVEQYRTDLLKEWRRLIDLLDQADAQGRFPVQLIGGAQDVPFILSRDRVLLPVEQDVAFGLLSEVSASTSLPPAAAGLLDLVSTTLQSCPSSQLTEFTMQAAQAARNPLSIDIVEVVQDLWEQTLGADEEVEAIVSDSLQALATADNAERDSDGLESAFWILSDALADDANNQALQGRQAQQSLSATPLGISFLADGTYQAIRARQRLAQGLTILAAFLTQAADDIAQNFERLPDLLPRLLGNLNILSTLVRLADTSTESAVDASLLVSTPEHDSIATQLQRLTVGSEAPLVGIESDNVLHMSLLKGLLPRPSLSQEQWPASFPTAVASILTSLGLERSSAEMHQMPRLPLGQASLAHQLLGLGYAGTAAQMAESYQLSSLSYFLLGKAFLLQRRFEEARDAFVMGRTAQQSDILPLRDSVAYYHYASDLFERAESPAMVAFFCKLAVQSTDDADYGEDTPASKLRDLHFHLFRAGLSLGDYAACYTTVMSMPDELDTLRRDCIRTLISTMCEGGESCVAQLLGMNFAGMQNEVERNLSFKARNSNPTSSPNFYSILYSYHISRGDYKSAGAVMYQQAHRLADLHRHQVDKVVRPIPSLAAAEEYVAIAIQQARSYLASINALSMLSEQDAWFAHASAEDDPSTLRQYIPQQHWQPDSNGIRIVQHKDVNREYALVLARLELVQLYPELATTDAVNPNDAVSLFLRKESYDCAFAVARATGVDQSGIFSTLALKCAATEYEYVQGQGDDDDDEGGEDEGAKGWSFLTTCDRTSSWIGSPAQKAWRYLRLNLEIEDAASGPQTRWKHRVVTLERLLSLSPGEGGQGKIPIPVWLTTWFQHNQPEMLIRAYLKSGLIDDALHACLTWIQESSKRNNAPTTTHPQCISYTLIDIVLKTAIDPDLRPTRTRGSQSAAETRKLADRLKKECVEGRLSMLLVAWKEEQAWGNKMAKARGRESRGEGEGAMEWA